MSSLGYSSRPAPRPPPPKPETVVIIQQPKIINRISLPIGWEGVFFILSAASLSFTQVIKYMADLSHAHPHHPQDFVEWSVSLQLNLIMVVACIDLGGVLFAVLKYTLLPKIGDVANRILRGTTTTLAAGGLALLLPIYQNLTGEATGDPTRLDTPLLVASYWILVVVSSLRTLAALYLTIRLRLRA